MSYRTYPVRHKICQALNFNFNTINGINSYNHQLGVYIRSDNLPEITNLDISGIYDMAGGGENKVIMCRMGHKVYIYFTYCTHYSFYFSFFTPFFFVQNTIFFHPCSKFSLNVVFWIIYGLKNHIPRKNNWKQQYLPFQQVPARNFMSVSPFEKNN